MKTRLSPLKEVAMHLFRQRSLKPLCAALLLAVGLVPLEGFAPGWGQTTASERTFSLAPVPDFALPGAIPNAAYLESEGEVVLIYAYQDALVEASSLDGIRFQGLGRPTEVLNDVFGSEGRIPVGMIVHETPGGHRRYFFTELKPRGQERYIYSADRQPDGRLRLNNGGHPVYRGGPDDNGAVSVIDIVEAPDGRWRMFYCAPNSERGGSRTAISADGGLHWTFESDNPFGDIVLQGHRAENTNVDPAPLRLQDGTYMAVTMRQKKLYFWNSNDGLQFQEVPNFSVDATLFQEQAPGAAGLFDPSLVQLPDGTILMYVAAGEEPSGEGVVIVAARITIGR